MQTAPLELRTLLRVKFCFWFFPVALLSVSLYTAGALSVGVGAFVAISYGFSSLCMAYGIVGAACGLGATYARFDWESPSQLCAGFGSLMYMLYSTFLIVATMIPSWHILFSTSQGFLSGSPSLSDLWRVGLNASTIFIINFIGAQLALRSGEKALERMRSQALG